MLTITKSTISSDIGVVIVTYNRLQKLKKTLRAYEAQTLLPEYVIVVDNASNDDTGSFLKTWQEKESAYEKIVITAKENSGGSGGFYLGETRAMDLQAGWIMVGDDDAYPCPEYIEGISRYISDHQKENLAIVCGKVMERGTPVNVHRTFWRSQWDKDFHDHVPADMYQRKEFYPDFTSYVGPVMKKEKLQQAGLINPEHFIWCDDTEHTYRLSRTGRLVCLTYLTMYHDVEEDNKGLSWKNYYGIRNDLYFFKKYLPVHYPFVMFKLFCKAILSPLKGKTLTEMKMRFAAMYDSLMGRMGKHEIYKPGWKP